VREQHQAFFHAMARSYAFELSPNRHSFLVCISARYYAGVNSDSTPCIDTTTMISA
jgi:hypothetical protein